MSEAPPSFLDELKRRKVARAAAVYGAVVFVVLQVADLVFPALGFPEWTYSFVVVLSLLGFPIALVLSWAFDLTAEGVKRTEAADSPVEEGEASREGWLSLRTVSVAVVLLLGGWFAGRMSGGGIAETEARGDGDSINSIAVLPFTDMSPDGDQEYFGDGIAEELLNALAKIPDLQVAARTSAFSFKGKNADIATIAEALKVQTVLEGSVRKAGGQLRITAQLIRADNGFRLWSETYDRPAADVFAVQDEISRSIVDALRVQLTGEEEADLTRRGTDDQAAYDLYLRGRYQWSRRTEVGLRGAAASFSEAIRLDSTYAEAHAGLSDALAMSAAWMFEPLANVMLPAQTAALKAVELDDRSAAAHKAHAHNLYVFSRSWAEAEQEFRKALQLEPTNAEVHHWYGVLLRSRGQIEEALAEIRRAAELDPLNLQILTTLAATFEFRRDFEQAWEAHRAVLEVDPDYAGAHWGLARTAILLGRFDQALAELDEYARLSKEMPVDRSVALWGLGRRAEATALLETTVAALDAGFQDPAYIATAYAMMGDPEEAFAWLERAAEEGSYYVVAWLHYPWLDPIRSDPRFEGVLSRAGLGSSTGSGGG